MDICYSATFVSRNRSNVSCTMIAKLAKNNNIKRHLNKYSLFKENTLASHCTVWSNWYLHVINAGSRPERMFPVTVIDWQPPWSSSYLQCT